MSLQWWLGRKVDLGEISLIDKMKIARFRTENPDDKRDDFSILMSIRLSESMRKGGHQ